jgi:hypothetical protein
MKSKNNNNNDDDDDDGDGDDDDNNNTAMGSVHARGDTFLTFGFKSLTETNTSRLAIGWWPPASESIVTTSAKILTVTCCCNWVTDYKYAPPSLLCMT